MNRTHTAETIINNCNNKEHITKCFNSLVDLHVGDVVQLQIPTPTLDTDTLRNTMLTVTGVVVDVTNSLYETVDNYTKHIRFIRITLDAECDERLHAIRNRITDTSVTDDNSIQFE